MATIKLFEAWLQSALNEVGPSGGIDLSKLVATQEILDRIKEDEAINFFYEEMKVLIKRNGIIFSCTPETAAAIIAVHESDFIFQKTSLPKAAQVMSPVTSYESIKLMNHPEDPSKVLTTGQFLPDRIEEPADDSMASEYQNVALFCNNSALLALCQDEESLSYHLNTDKNTNSLTWQAKGTYNLSWLNFYGTTKTTSAASKQAIKTTTWTVPAEGKTLVKPLPGSMFATGEATLADTKDLDAAIAELTALVADKTTKITKIEILSSASGDRGIGGVSGYPKGTAAGTYTVAKPYLPKSAAESANAKLAFDRGATLKSKLTSFGAPISITALISDGGDAAQFAKLIVTIEMADKPAQTLSKQELDNLLLKPKTVTDLAETRVLTRWGLRNFKA